LSRVTVIGLDGGRLDAEAEALLSDAALVVGGERHLRCVGVDPSAPSCSKEICPRP
jgi:precorrin-6B methylase 1